MNVLNQSPHNQELKRRTCTMSHIRKPLSILLVLMLLATMFTGLTLTASAATPVVWLKFDDNLNDSSGNNRNAVYKDGTEPTYVAGNVSKAVRLDHTLLEIQNTAAMKLNKTFSYSIWMKYDPDMLDATYLLLPRGNSYTINAGTGYDQTGVYNAMNFYNKDYPGDASFDVYENPYTASYLTTEHHTDKYMNVVFSFDGTTSRVWIDGKLDKTESLVNADHYGDGTFLPHDGNFILGGYDSSWFVGNMDDLRIYDTALTNADVTTIFNEGKVSRGSNTMIVTLNEANMMVNGVNQEIDPGRGTVAESLFGRTRVPIANFMKVWGAPVPVWNGTERKVTLVYKGTTIELWIDRNKAKVNGVEVQIDERDPLVVPLIKNGRTMLPLAFVMTQFKIDYLWKGDVRQIHIFY